MRVNTHTLDEREYGVVELTDGYHVGTTVTMWIADDGAPVVQIDTPEDTETHEVVRVYVNDALVSGREVKA